MPGRLVTASYDQAKSTLIAHHDSYWEPFPNGMVPCAWLLIERLIYLFSHNGLKCIDCGGLKGQTFAIALNSAETKPWVMAGVGDLIYVYLSRAGSRINNNGWYLGIWSRSRCLLVRTKSLAPFLTNTGRKSLTMHTLLPASGGARLSGSTEGLLSVLTCKTCRNA